MHRKLFSKGILGIENVGGDRGDGCIIRLVAITDSEGAYRIEPGRPA